MDAYFLIFKSTKKELSKTFRKIKYLNTKLKILKLSVFDLKCY